MVASEIRQAGWPGRHTVVALILGALAVIAYSTPAVQAAPAAQRGMAVHVTPDRVTTQPGGSAAYVVTVASTKGFTGQVELSVTGLPGGAVPMFDPAPSIMLGVGSTVSAALTVQVPATVHRNSYPLTVTATGDGVRARDTALLRVAPRPEITVAVAPRSRAVVAGGSVSYRVVVTARHGFHGEVTLGVGTLPSGVHLAGISPATLNLDQHHQHRGATVTLAVDPGTVPRRYPFTVTATRAGVTASDDVELRVVPAGTLTVTADPTEVSVAQGERAGVRITVQRSGVPGRVRLGVSGLPPGARARFDPRVLGPLEDMSRLTIHAGERTPPGTYPVTVTARSGGVSGSMVVTLEVVASGLPFTISGDLGQDLYPGLTVPLNLTFDNPNAGPLQVRGVYVTIDRVDAPGPCPVAENFAVTQFSGDYDDLVIPAGGSVSLEGLGIPDTVWPQVSMLDTGTNQNGCMGAELSLHYTGIAKGAQP